MYQPLSAHTVEHMSINFEGEIFKKEEFCPEEEVKLMQFTGLLDKNGKEIYEGDIVHVSGGYGKQENRVIGWWEDTAGWGYVYNTGEQYMKFRYFLSGFRCDRIEIIGNIYEDGHLLEK